MEPFIDKNVGIRSQRVGIDRGRENDNSKMDNNRRSLLSADVKRTVQDNASVKRCTELCRCAGVCNN